MARRCTHVILLYDDGSTRVYDPTKIDSIFFDQARALCFAQNCLDDPQPQLSASGNGFECIHMKNCEWDCGSEEPA